jgi:hypothetical protein
MADILGLDRRAHDIALRRGGDLPEGREQVTGEQGACDLFVDQAGVPAVRDVRSIDPADPPAAEVKHLSVGQGAWCAIRQIRNGHQHPGAALDHVRRRGGRQPAIHRPHLIGLDMPEAQPPQSLQGNDPRHRPGDCRKHLPVPAVPQQRLLGHDEELVEHQVRRLDIGRDAVHVLSDLTHIRSHFVSSCRDLTW